jgi:hypothetical protein
MPTSIANLNLDLLVIPTYSKLTLGIADNSTYPTGVGAPTIQGATIVIGVPNFGNVTLPFNINSFNVFNSATLGLSAAGTSCPIPDGVYTLNYSIYPNYLNYVNKSFIRTEILQESFDAAFMQLDMMECDMAIKKQDKVDLSTIYFFIQGAIAAANNCAIAESNKLYNQASKMLNNFMKNGCRCYGNNYLTNFK